MAVAGAVLIWERSSSGGLLIHVLLKAIQAVTVVGLLGLWGVAFLHFRKPNWLVLNFIC